MQKKSLPDLPLEIWRMICGFATSGIIKAGTCPTFEAMFLPEHGPGLQSTKHALLLTSRHMHEVSKPFLVESVQLTLEGMRIFLQKLRSGAIQGTSVKAVSFVGPSISRIHLCRAVEVLQTATQIISYCTNLDTLDITAFIHFVPKE